MAGEEIDGADLAEVGVAPEEVAKLHALYGTAERGADTVLVTPDNWPAVQVFLAQERRWRRTPMGDMEGLDLVQVESAARMLGIKRGLWQGLLRKLLRMEQAALEEMAR